jgi:hypothetical protein
VNEIINKIAGSDLKIIDLADFSDASERLFFDLKDLLFQGQILRENDFRKFIANHDWTFYEGKNIAIGCSVDAVIPAWAYMLLVTKMQPFAGKIVIGDLEMLENEIFRDAISSLPLNEFENAKIIIKGCGEVPIPDFAFAEITRVLRPVASSIMYGEPCSTVPIYKKSR